MRNKQDASTKKEQSPKVYERRNRIDLSQWALVIINIVLAYYTYRLFNKTVESTDIANKAVTEATKANEISKANLILAQQQAASNDSLSNENLNLSKQSLDAQIGTMQETVKQFGLSNEPYLQITNPAFTDLYPNKTVYISYVLKNYGELPAVITDQWMGVGTVNKQGLENLTKSPFMYADFKAETPNRNFVIAKETTDTMVLPVPIKLDIKQLNSLIDGETYCYFFGKILFRSTAQKNIREYKFCIILMLDEDKSTQITTTRYRFIYNDSPFKQ